MLSSNSGPRKGSLVTMGIFGNAPDMDPVVAAFVKPYQKPHPPIGVAATSLGLQVDSARWGEGLDTDE